MAHTGSIYCQYYESPVGWLQIEASDTAVTGVNFRDDVTEKACANNVTRESLRQLREYFEKSRADFDLPLETEGTTFQKIVWNELLNIPFGQTISYLELSKRIGNIKAIRAVGHANGQNPISIIIPCHRVIGSNGSLTGYGGGLWRKKWLLQHEGLLRQLELAL